MESERLTGVSNEPHVSPNKSQRRYAANWKWAAFTTCILGLGATLLWAFFHFIVLI